MRHQRLANDPDEYVEEGDELHLVSESSHEPLIGPTAILTTFLNALLMSAFIVYIVKSEFTFNFFTFLLGICAAAAFIANCFVAAKIYQRVRDESLRMGRPEEFRDYANRVNTNEPVIHEKVAEDFRRKFPFWPREKRPVYV
jgi:hypothetical protein